VSETDIRHVEQGAHGEFFIEVDGRRVAELTYRVSGSDAIADHTWVDPHRRGGTLARDLVEALVAWARTSDRKVVPACSYVRAAFERNAAYADVRASSSS
jgi:predicted GNAT family acetyltransferase